MSFDLKKNDSQKLAEQGYTFDVVMPDGTITDMKFEIRGSKSKIVVDFYRNYFSKRQVSDNAYKKRYGRDPEPISFAESEDFAIEASALRIKGWSNVVEDKVEIKYSPEEATRLMREYPDLREVVMKESEELLNFRPAGD